MSTEKTKDKGLMTRLSEEKGVSEVGATLGALSALVGGIILGGKLLDRALPATGGDKAAKEARLFETDITNGQKVRVLEHGSALVESVDSGKSARIENPVVTATGHVIGRDKYTGQVVVYFRDKLSEDKEGSASKITFTEDGKPVSKEQAITDSVPLVLETPQKVGNEFAYVAAKGQGYDNVPVAVASPEKTITVTTTEVVPDKG